MVYLLPECLFLPQHGHLDVFLLHLYLCPLHTQVSARWAGQCLQQIEMDVRC